MIGKNVIVFPVVNKGARKPITREEFYIAYSLFLCAIGAINTEDDIIPFAKCNKMLTCAFMRIAGTL